MDAITGFLLVAALITLLAAAVAFIIRKPLGQILIEVCGNADRGRFWQVFSNVFLVLTALSGTLLFPPEAQVTSNDAVPSFQAFLASFRAGVFGLLLSLGAIGFVLMRAILAQTRRQPASQPPVTNPVTPTPLFPPWKEH